MSLIGQYFSTQNQSDQLLKNHFSLRYRWYRDQGREKLTLDKTKLPLWTRFNTWLDPDSAITPKKLLDLQKLHKDDADEIQDSIGGLNQEIINVKGKVREFFRI